MVGGSTPSLWDVTSRAAMQGDFAHSGSATTASDGRGVSSGAGGVIFFDDDPQWRHNLMNVNSSPPAAAG